MRSASAAEWILSLFTPPDRAASIVGDLTEESSARGALWFWSSVLRTACSHFWRDLSASPWRMVGLAFWGFLAHLVLCSSVVLATVYWHRAWMTAGYRSAMLPSWGYEIIFSTAVPFLVGWMLARRAEVRELAAVFSVACLFAAWPWLLRCLNTLPGVRIGGHSEHEFATDCAITLFMAAGAILFRRRAIRGATHA